MVYKGTHKNHDWSDGNLRAHIGALTAAKQLQEARNVASRAAKPRRCWGMSCQRVRADKLMFELWRKRTWEETRKSPLGGRAECRTKLGANAHAPASKKSDRVSRSQVLSPASSSFDKYHTFATLSELEQTRTSNLSEESSAQISAAHSATDSFGSLCRVLAQSNWRARSTWSSPSWTHRRRPSILAEDRRRVGERRRG